MKKLLLLFVFSGFVFTQSQAQNVSYDLTKGEEMRDKIGKRTMGVQHLLSDSNCFYYLYQPNDAIGEVPALGGGYDYYIARFEKDNLKQVEKKKVELASDLKKNKIQGVFGSNKEIYVFTTFNNNKHKKHYLFVHRVNKESLEVEEDLKKIGEIDYSDIKKHGGTDFSYEFSQDSSKILIYYSMTNDLNQIVRNGMYIYSDEMELIWKNENVKPEIKKGVFAYQDFKVDNSGNVYIKGANYIDMDSYNSSANFKPRGFLSSDKFYADYPNYVTQIYKYSNEGKDQTYISLKLQDKFIRSLTFLPDENGQLLCAGIYSATAMISAKGSFVFNLDIEKNEISNLETKEFGSELIESGFDEKEIKKLRRAMDNSEEWDPYQYILTDIKTDSKGNKYFAAEQYIQGSRSDNTGTFAILNRNDLYITRIGEDNKIERVDKIKKRQQFIKTRMFNSYAMLENEGVLYFVFNNFNQENTIVNVITHGETYLVALDSEGNEEREIIQSTKDKDKIYMLTKSAFQDSNNSLIFSSASSAFKDYRVNRIVFE